MYHKIEHCDRCFTILNRGWWSTRKVKKEFKNKGHILFEETKRGKRIYQLIFSTRTYSADILLHKRK